MNSSHEYLETGLRRPVGVDELGIRVAVVREHRKRRVAIEPASVFALRHERRAHEPHVVPREQLEECGISR